MAGDSPDGAEQRKSSGETAGGRTGRAADPRLAVLRDRLTGAVAVADEPEAAGEATAPGAVTAEDTPDDAREAANGSGSAADGSATADGGGRTEGASGGRTEPGAAGSVADDAAEEAEAADGSARGSAAEDADGPGEGPQEPQDGVPGADGAPVTPAAPAAPPGPSAAATAPSAPDPGADASAAEPDESDDPPSATDDASPGGTPAAPAAEAPGAADEAAADEAAADGDAAEDIADDDAPTTASPVVEDPAPAAGAPADRPSLTKPSRPASVPTRPASVPATESARPASVPATESARPAPAATASAPAAAGPRTDAPTARFTAPAAPPAAPADPFGDGRPTARDRTRQQPLPPSPEESLKLLAALTNTPEPPPTALRTALRRVRIWTPLVVLLAIVFCVVQALRPLPAPTLALRGADAYTFGGAKPSVPWPSEGQAALEVEGLGSFGTYGAQRPEPIASVAKIMTAYIVLHDHPFAPGAKGVTLTVDQRAAADYQLGAEGESVVKVTAGARITQYEALEDIMIASANNIARMLARWDAGSEAAFVRKMNTTARRLGMTHTTYTDPSGLTATTVSTATDQLKLAEKAMDNPVFREVVDETSYRTAGGDTYANWNHLVGTDGVVGVKTGTSTKAGGNLVVAAYQPVGGTDQLILGVVLGQYRPSILDTVTAASQKLVLAAQHELTSAKVIRKGDVVGWVDDGLGRRTPVVATRDVRAVGWPGIRVPIALRPGTVPHAAKAGTKVGTLTVGDGPGQIRIPVALGTDLTAPGLADKLTRLG